MLRRLVAAFALLVVFAGSAVAVPQDEFVQGGTSADDWSRAMAITIADDGDLYVAGYYRGELGTLASSDSGAYVQRLTPDLDVVWEISIPEPSAFALPPIDLWLDGDDQLWVKANHRIGVYDTTDGSEINAPDFLPIGNEIRTLDGNPHGSGLVGATEFLFEVTLVESNDTVGWTYDFQAEAAGPVDGQVLVRSTPTGFIALASVTDTGASNDQSTSLVGLAPDGSFLWSNTIEERRIEAEQSGFLWRPSLAIVNDGVLHLMMSTSTGRVLARIDTANGELLDTRTIDDSTYCLYDIVGPRFPEPAETVFCEPGTRQPHTAEPRLIGGQPAAIHPDGDEIVSYRTGLFSGDLGTILRHDLLPDPVFDLLQAVPVADDAVVYDLAFAPNGDLYVAGSTNTDGIGLLATASVNPRAFVALNPWTHGFSDITRSWQDDPVFWMKQNGITNGVSRTEYAPDRNITRGELAALFYRANGNPDPGDPHPFDDIVRGWQNDPVSWMKTNGITTGVSDTEFAPDRDVTRGEIAAFMWRMAGFPDVDTPHGFDDVTASWQQPAVRWLKASGITGGVSDTEYAPGRSVTRGEVAAFLFRYDNTIGLPLG